MSGQRLLIVDDEGSIRDMLAFFFHKKGFEVMTASNFTEGQASALRSTPDLHPEEVPEASGGVRGIAIGPCTPGPAL